MNASAMADISCAYLIHIQYTNSQFYCQFKKMKAYSLVIAAAKNMDNNDLFCGSDKILCVVLRMYVIIQTKKYMP